MKKIVVALLALVLVFSLAACGKSEAVKNVEGLISSIGEVDLEKEASIKSAEDAYNALAEEEKADVASYEELKAAREKYDTLKKEAAEKAKKEAAIKNVEELIGKINAVDLENASKIQAAKKAYDKLPEEDRAKVKKGNELDGMLKKLETLKKDAADRLLAEMTHDEDRVRGLDFYYPNTFEWYDENTWAADIRCFVLPYIGKDSNSAWLRLLYNYTGDDWVFYKSIIAAVDGKQYYKTFKYFDIVHDNDGGLVWEYIDTEATDSDIEMLWAIAKSEETIIRFQGDDYTHDYIVNAADKQAIADTLTAYAALS